MAVLNRLARAIDAAKVYVNVKALNSRRLPTNPAANEFQYLTTDGSVDGHSYVYAGGDEGLPNGLVTYGGVPVTYGGAYVTYGV